MCKIMYKLMVIDKDTVITSQHTSRLAMLNKMAYHRRNGRYSFVSEHKSYIDVMCNMDRVRQYQRDCKLSNLSGVMAGQAWLQGLWDSQGINVLEELKQLKKGKLKF